MPLFELNGLVNTSKIKHGTAIRECMKSYQREAFIQLNKDKTGWFSGNCQDVAEYLAGNGFLVSGFGPDDIDYLIRSGRLTKETPFKGSIRTTRKIFGHLDIPQPKNMDIPDFILESPKLSKKYLNRKIVKTTVKRLKKHFEGDQLPGFRNPTVHVKSLDYQKGIMGTCMSRGYHLTYDDGRTPLPDDYKLLVSEEVDFARERRFFVRNAWIINEDINRDDLRLLEFARELVADMHKFMPKHKVYCFDVGYSYPEYISSFEKRSISLVEFNEAYSSGNSGLNPATYAKFALEGLKQYTNCLDSGWPF